MEPDENPLIGLGRCEQKTIYQGPGSIWKQRVNYKQQGLSTICSTLNDVILTLKLPETHLLRTVLCSMNYPLRFERASSPCLFAQPFHFLSTGAAASTVRAASRVRHEAVVCTMNKLPCVWENQGKP